MKSLGYLSTDRECVLGFSENLGGLEVSYGSAVENKVVKGFRTMFVMVKDANEVGTGGIKTWT